MTAGVLPPARSAFISHPSFFRQALRPSFLDFLIHIYVNHLRPAKACCIVFPGKQDDNNDDNPNKG